MKKYSFNKGEIHAEIEIELKEKGEKKIFSASGTIWDGCKIDKNIISAGQCLGIIKEYFSNNKKVNELVELWEKYHLNDLRAGTPKQEKFLKDNKIMAWDNDYTNVCNILKENNLYNDNGYIFGSGWLYEAIPSEDLKRIEKLIKGVK